MLRKKTYLIVMLCLAGVWNHGCASSASSTSSESVSDIITSPFKSSSTSSDAVTAYRDDVRALSTAYIENSQDDDAFVRALGEVAAVHGLVDWEAAPETFLAIGDGLRDAGLSLEQARSFSRRLFGEDARIEEWISDAYPS